MSNSDLQSMSNNIDVFKSKRVTKKKYRVRKKKKKKNKNVQKK